MWFDLDDEVEHPQEIAGGEDLHPLGEFFLEPVGEVRQRASEDARELRAQQVREVSEEDREVDAMVGEAGDRSKDVAGAPLSDDIEQRQMLVLMHEPEGLAHSFGGDHPAAEGEDLIGEREGVAHGTVGGAREHPKGIGLRLEPLGREHRHEARAHVRWTDPFEVESLHAREHRRGGLLDLVGLGRRKNEDHARRRFLEDLEERVPGFTREHVRLVDDVDLVAVLAGRGVHGALPEFAGVVHAAIRGGVDLNDVERRASAPDPGTRGALAAGLVVGALVLTVERHGEHARERRLAGTAGPAEQVRVTEAVAGDRVAQRVRNVRLDGDLGEAARTVLAGEREGHGYEFSLGGGIA